MVPNNKQMMSTNADRTTLLWRPSANATADLAVRSAQLPVIFVVTAFWPRE